MYWEKDDDILCTPGISALIGLVKFEQILRFLHLADNSCQRPPGHPEHDRLFKVRRYTTLITNQFETNYTLNQSVTIDEVMIPYKGRLAFKQYIKNKPTKWGIKVFVLSDATNGYISRLQIYTEKNVESGHVDAGLCSRVLLDLISGVGEGFHLYTDNYYTGPVVYKALYDQGINSCGTVRTNRTGFPEVLKKGKSEQVPRGYYEYLSCGPLLAAVWYDRRFVYFVSTLHKAERDGDTIPRHAQDGSIVDVPSPPLLPDYQKCMRGVDRGDQLISCYNMGRRSKKWWKRVFLYLIECSLLNAYILEKYAKPHLHDESNKGHNKRDFLSFRIDVAHQLIGCGTYREKAGRPPGGDHAPESRLDKDLSHCNQKSGGVLFAPPLEQISVFPETR